MKDTAKTRSQLMRELSEAQQRIVELEASQSECKRIQEALRESEERFRRLSEAAFEAIAFSDRATILDVNEQFATMFGYERSEVIGKHGLHLVAPQSRDLVMANITSMYDKPYKLMGLKKDGTVFPVEACGKSVPYNGRTVRVTAIRDLTEHKRAEEALRESERRWRTLLENVRLIVVGLDVHGHVEYVNPFFLELSGYMREEVIGKHWFSHFVPFRDREKVGIAFRELLQKEYCAHYENPILAKSGRQREIGWYNARLLDPHGQVVGTLSVGKDVTEEKRVEAELTTRARQQAAVAELGQRALAGIPLSALMDEVVTLVAQTLGVEYSKVLELLPDGNSFLLKAGVGWKEGLVGHATVGAESNSQTGYTLLSDAPVIVEDVRTEMRFSSPDVLLDHGVVSGISVIIFGEDRPFGVLGAHTTRRRAFTKDDVHFLQGIANVLGLAIERIRIEEALRESEERFRGAFETAAIGMALVAPDGRWVRVNRSLCKIVGYSENELLSTNFQAITHPDDLESDLHYVRQMLAGEIPYYHMEKRYVHKQGHVVWILLSVSLVRDARGTPLYFVSQIQDITKRKRAEEVLQRYAERLKILHDIDQAVLGAQSFNAIAQAAVRHIRDLVPCVRASIALFNVEANEARILAAHADGETQVGPGRVLPLEETFGPLADLRQEKVRVVGDILALAKGFPLTEDLLAEGVRSYITVPLASEREIIGTLNLGRSETHSFTPEDLDIAREVADSLAIAIQNARLFEEIRAGRERLQTLSRRLVEVQEAERRRIGRELHDEIGQVLTGLKLALETRTCSTGATDGFTLDAAQGLVNELMTRVRELSLDLRPPMLDDLGLLPALLWQSERYIAQTQVRVDLRHRGLERRFSPEVETAAYRIVQEALTNVARHAGVGEVAVRLWAGQGILGVQVEDRGKGFDPEAVQTSGVSSGLTGMHERVATLSGSLTVESRPGAGTRVTAELPLRDALREREGC